MYIIQYTTIVYYIILYYIIFIGVGHGRQRVEADRPPPRGLLLPVLKRDRGRRWL